MEGLTSAQIEGRTQLMEEAIQKHLIAKVKRGLASIEHVYKLYKDGSIVQLIVSCRKETEPIMRDAFRFSDGTTDGQFAAQEITDMFRTNLELFVLRHLDDYPNPDDVTLEEYERGIKKGTRFGPHL